MKSLFTKIKFLFLLFTLSICTSTALAFEAPKLTGPVVDLAKMISPEVKNQITEKLIRFRNEHGPQIQVLTVSTTENISIEDYAQSVFVAWKLGNATRDDGVLFVIAKQERKMRIHVGFGLEGTLTDALTSQILRENTKPAFKNGNFDLGIAQTVDRILFEVRPDQFEKPVSSVSSSAQFQDEVITAIVFGAFLIFFFIIFFIVIFSSKKSGNSTIQDSSTWFDSSSDSSSSSDSWSGGGGDSGGGGASDSW